MQNERGRWERGRDGGIKGFAVDFAVREAADA